MSKHTPGFTPKKGDLLMCYYYKIPSMPKEGIDLFYCEVLDVHGEYSTCRLFFGENPPIKGSEKVKGVFNDVCTSDIGNHPWEWDKKPEQLRERARQFFKGWLWGATERKTQGMPWSNEHSADACSLMTAFHESELIASAPELKAENERLREAIESLRQELDAMRADRDLARKFGEDKASENAQLRERVAEIGKENAAMKQAIAETINNTEIINKYLDHYVKP